MNNSSDLRLLPWLVAIVVSGVAILVVMTGLSGSIPILGRLPGDFFMMFPRGYIFLPVTSGMLISGLVTLFLTVLTKDKPDSSL